MTNIREVKQELPSVLPLALVRLTPARDPSWVRENVEKLGEHEIRLLETENGVFESLKRDEFWLLMKENERTTDLKIRERVQELETRMLEALAKTIQKNVRELHVEEKVEQKNFD